MGKESRETKERKMERQTTSDKFIIWMLMYIVAGTGSTATTIRVQEIKFSGVTTDVEDAYICVASPIHLSAHPRSSGGFFIGIKMPANLEDVHHIGLSLCNEPGRCGLI